MSHNSIHKFVNVFLYYLPVSLRKIFISDSIAPVLSVTENFAKRTAPQAKSKEVPRKAHVAKQGEDENTSSVNESLNAKSSTLYLPLYFSQLKHNILRYQNPSDKKAENIQPEWFTRRKNVISKESIDDRTRFLVGALGNQITEEGNLMKLLALNEHLKLYPQAKGCAVKAGALHRSLHLIRQTKNDFIQAEGRELLAMLGYVFPLPSKGIRLLSIDGGGMRGLVAIELLRTLENKTGQAIHRLFDVICGVSTGAIIAALLGGRRLSADLCHKLYLNLSMEVFSQTTLRGATGFVMHSSYYNSDNWKEMLKANVGTEVMIKTAREKDTPKLCFVSSKVNQSGIKPFVFRNYQLPYRVASHYQGTCLARMWEGVVASAAAPGYFSEFRFGDLNLLDGGILVNNPTGIGLHEAKLLWPNSPLCCIVSLGTGRHEPVEAVSDGMNWASRIKSFVNSATDTEGVHTLLHDLLPRPIYFRLNPYLTEELNMDEIRKEKLDLLLEDVGLYIRKNDSKLNAVAAALLQQRSLLSQFQDWFGYQQLLWLH